MALNKIIGWDDLEVLKPLSLREHELKMEVVQEFKH